MTVTFCEGERVLASPVVWRRVGVAGVQGAAAVVAGLAGFGFTDSAAVVVRNGLTFGGVALLSAVVFPPALSWAPVVMAATGTWIVGVPPVGDPIPEWAVLLKPFDNAAAGMIALAVQAAGVAAVLTTRRPYWSQ